MKFNNKNRFALLAPPIPVPKKQNPIKPPPVKEKPYESEEEQEEKESKGFKLSKLQKKHLRQAKKKNQVSLDKHSEIEISNQSSSLLLPDSSATYEISSSPSSSLDIQNETDKESKEKKEKKAEPNIWEPMKELIEVYFDQSLNALFTELSKFDQPSIEFYIKGGFVRDKYLGIKPNDSDIIIKIKSANPDIRRNLAHLLKTTFGAFQMPYDKNIYRTKAGLMADITILEGEEDCKAPDALINGFILKPSALPGKSVDKEGVDVERFEGVFCYPIKYFKTSQEALEHLGSGILETPQCPAIHFQEDPVRILRFCRLATVRPLKLTERVAKAMYQSASELNIKKIIGNHNLFGRVFAELAKIEAADQNNYLLFLNKMGILSQLFAGNFTGSDRTVYVFNFQNLVYFLRDIPLKDLFVLHSMGFAFKIDSQGCYIPWLHRQQNFVKKIKNIFDLLFICQKYNLPFQPELINRLLESGRFDPASIKGIWGDLTRSLSQLLLNGEALNNFQLLRDSGIFGFLFPNANKAINQSQVHLNYIMEILLDTQSHTKPSIGFVYTHFLALEVAHTPDAPEKTIEQLSHLHDGRYRSIIEPMNEPTKEKLIGSVTSMRKFSSCLRKQQPKKNPLTQQILLTLSQTASTHSTASLDLGSSR